MPEAVREVAEDQMGSKAAELQLEASASFTFGPANVSAGSTPSKQTKGARLPQVPTHYESPRNAPGGVNKGGNKSKSSEGVGGGNDDGSDSDDSEMAFTFGTAGPEVATKKALTPREPAAKAPGMATVKEDESPSSKHSSKQKPSAIDPYAVPVPPPAPPGILPPGAVGHGVQVNSGESPSGDPGLHDSNMFGPNFLDAPLLGGGGGAGPSTTPKFATGGLGHHAGAARVPVGYATHVDPLTAAQYEEQRYYAEQQQQYYAEQQRQQYIAEYYAHHGTYPPGYGYDVYAAQNAAAAAYHAQAQQQAILQQQQAAQAYAYQQQLSHGALQHMNAAAAQSQDLHSMTKEELEEMLGAEKAALAEQEAKESGLPTPHPADEEAGAGDEDDSPDIPAHKVEGSKPCCVIM
mmetsp:Transcript_7380/g.17734  ORF Transcript_7380/g.17734 Transcript_7380/m.17734 type:complete len:406 (-) Transcript_7380:215-1432(-)